MIPESDSKEFQELLERHRRSDALFVEIANDPEEYFRRENRKGWRTPNPILGNSWTLGWSSWVKNNLFLDHSQSRAAFRWSMEWPLPVGRASLWSYSSGPQEFGTITEEQSFLGSLMPFDGDELAPGIFVASVAECRVEAFCLGYPVDEEVGLLRPSGVRFRVTTTHRPIIQEVTRYMAGVQDWWKKCARQPIQNSGRPPGSACSLDDLYKLYRDERSAGRARTMTEFASFVNIDERHLRRRLAAVGGWKVFRKDS